MRKPWYSFLYVRSPIVKILWGIASVLLAIVILLVVGIWEEPRMQAQTGNWEGRSIEKGAEIYANNCSSCHGPNGQGIPGPALNSNYFFTQRLADVGFTGTLEDYVRLTVAAGRPSKTSGQWGVVMPTWGARFGGPLRDDQVQQVTNYVLNWEQSAVEQTDEEDPWIPFEDTPSQAAEGDGSAAAAEGEPAEGEMRAPEELFANTSMACEACHNLNEPQTETNRGPVGPNLGNLSETAPTREPGMDAETYVYNSIVTPNAHVVQGYMPNIMPGNFAERMSEEEINAMVQWLLDPNRTQ